MGDDRLHEPYRSRHITQLPDIVAAAVAAGALGAALSGAGSAIIALADDEKVADRVASAMSDSASESEFARTCRCRPAGSARRSNRRCA